MDQNAELLQTVGQLYMELKRVQYILQHKDQQIEQFNKDVQGYQAQIKSLEAEISKSKVTIKEFQDIVVKNDGPAQGE